jgi:hypothetical protein
MTPNKTLINTTEGSLVIFNSSHNAKATCTHAVIKLINQHRQKHKQQYSKKKATEHDGWCRRELRIRMAIIEDVASMSNIIHPPVSRILFIRWSETSLKSNPVTSMTLPATPSGEECSSKGARSM